MDKKVKTQAEVKSNERLREKFLLTLEMFDLGVSIKKQSLQREFPDLSEEEKRKKLREWLQTRPGAESGDCSGKDFAVRYIRKNS